MKLKGLFLISLFCFLPQTYITAQKAATQESQFKILSWNIYMLPYISWFNHNGNRAREIGIQLQDSDFQIIVFQEAFSIKCRKILHNLLAEKYPYQYGPANSCLWPFKTSSGLWILSKIPLNELGSIRFKEAKGFDRIARKGAVLFEGKYNGTSFQLLATHLQANNPQQIRNAQYKEIALLLKQFYKRTTPQILCGDFNTCMSQQYHYTTMLQTLDAQNGELQGDLHVTYDEQNNTLAKSENGRQEVLDYILTRNSDIIATMQRKVLEFYTTKTGHKAHLSDHYALEATLQFTPALVAER